MSTPRLFCPDLRKGANVLSGEEAHHGLHALRLAVGDAAVVFNGLGKEAAGNIIKTSRRDLTVEVATVTSYGFDLSARLTLAVSMPKTHRQGYLVEKCTELGVAAIWPMTTTRTVAQPGLAGIDKWRRARVEAAKQSGRRWIPEIEPIQTFQQVISHAPSFDRAAIAHADEHSPFAHEWLADCEPDDKILVLVGPEGGWTDEEREAARSAALACVQITTTTLRTETAAVALATLFSVHNRA